MQKDLIMSGCSKTVTQQQLAAELGITGRRVRQLVEAHIFPQAQNRNYDLALCRERYDLFRTKHDTRAWDELYTDLEACAKQAEELIEAALDPTSTAMQVYEASRTVQELFSDLRFITAARSKSEAERELFLELWRGKEHDALQALRGRAEDLVAAGERFQCSPP
jgi:hypothetical protein